MPSFLGFDHVDTRVTSLAAVEGFYDRLMPLLGLVEKGTAYIDGRGEWHDADPEHPYNAIEYSEIPTPGVAPRFIGFIEDRAMVPVKTRIAFTVASDDLAAWEAHLRQIGAHEVECSGEMATYPAVFFEDPAGTRLEVCARVARSASTFA